MQSHESHELLARHRVPLLRYLTCRLPASEWHRADQLAADTCSRAFTPTLAAHQDTAGELPSWLAAAARATVRDALQAAPGDDEEPREHPPVDTVTPLPTRTVPSDVAEVLTAHHVTDGTPPTPALRAAA